MPLKAVCNKNRLSSNSQDIIFQQNIQILNNNLPQFTMWPCCFKSRIEKIPITKIQKHIVYSVERFFTEMLCDKLLEHTASTWQSARKESTIVCKVHLQIFTADKLTYHKAIKTKPLKIRVLHVSICPEINTCSPNFLLTLKISVQFSVCFQSFTETYCLHLVWNHGSYNQGKSGNVKLLGCKR